MAHTHTDSVEFAYNGTDYVATYNYRGGELEIVEIYKQTAVGRLAKIAWVNPLHAVAEEHARLAAWAEIEDRLDYEKHGEPGDA